MPRPSYRAAIEWIAYNDEPTLYDPETIAEQLTVLLVADTWGKDAMQVARAVVRARRADDQRHAILDAPDHA